MDQENYCPLNYSHEFNRYQMETNDIVPVFGRAVWPSGVLQEAEFEEF